MNPGEFQHYSNQMYKKPKTMEPQQTTTTTTKQLQKAYHNNKRTIMKKYSVRRYECRLYLAKERDST